jgi:hypothetical protein
MKCVDPSHDENPVEYEIPLVIIQPTPNPAITTTIKVAAGSGVEASDTLYSSLSFIGTGSVRIANGSPSLFSNSYNVVCNPATGEISSSGASTSATSRTVRIGQVDVTYTALPEDIYPLGQEGGPAMRTAVRAYVEYTVNNSTVNTYVPATNGDPVYVWSTFIPVQSK